MTLQLSNLSPFQQKDFKLFVDPNRLGTTDIVLVSKYKSCVFFLKNVRSTLQLDPVLTWSTDEKVRKCKFPVLKFDRMAWMTNPKGRKISDFLYLAFWRKSGATSDVSIGHHSLVFQGGSSCNVDRFWLDCLHSHFGIPHSQEVELFRNFGFFGRRWFFAGWDGLFVFSRNQLENALFQISSTVDQVAMWTLP